MVFTQTVPAMARGQQSAQKVSPHVLHARFDAFGLRPVGVAQPRPEARYRATACAFGVRSFWTSFRRLITPNTAKSYGAILPRCGLVQTPF